MKRRLDWLVLAVVAICTIYAGLAIAWATGVFGGESNAPTAIEQSVEESDAEAKPSDDDSPSSDADEAHASAKPTPSPSKSSARPRRTPTPKPSEETDDVRSFVKEAHAGNLVNTHDYKNDGRDLHSFITADGNVLCEWIQERWVACTLGFGPDPHPEDVQAAPDGASGHYDPHYFSIGSDKVTFGTLTSEGLLYQPCLSGQASPDEGLCPQVASVKTLPDGKAIQFGDVICGSNGPRVMCATTDGKHAIDVTRNDYTIYRR